MTKIIKSLHYLKLIRKKLLINNCSVGFVPTMGSLHDGHKSLLKRSKRENAITILSIFVNPTQFNDDNDFKNYPRTLKQDFIISKEEEVDYVLVPAYEDLYPDQYSYKLINTTCSQEVTFRPGHFDGVLTIVLKLLLIVKPTCAYFGEKDYQQLQLVKGLVKAFFIETNIVSCEVVRNEFGLPLSSRNRRLTKNQYQLAKTFSKVFHSNVSCSEIKKTLIQEGIKVDYIKDCNGRRFGAVHIGNVRLIDNIIL